MSAVNSNTVPGLWDELIQGRCREKTGKWHILRTHLPPATSCMGKACICILAAAHAKPPNTLTPQPSRKALIDVTTASELWGHLHICKSVHRTHV